MSKSTKKAEVTYVPIKNIVPDPDQPRRYFDATKIATLKESIKEHGLINPLMVEKQSDGKYLLVDGERRYRSMVELGIESVPVIVIESTTKLERRIKQFHLQGQHEGWSATEKANALKELSEEMGVDPKVMGRMLGMGERIISTYIAFSGILEKESYIKSEIPIGYSQSIVAAKSAARHGMKKMELKLHVEDERSLEKLIIEKIKTGEIEKESDVAKITDSFRKEPKSIAKFLKGKQTIEGLFEETMARGFTMARTISNEAGYTVSRVERALAHADILKVISETPMFRNRVKKAADTYARLVKALD